VDLLELLRRPEGKTLGVMILLGIALLITPGGATGQTVPRSPSELIRYLTYQSDRPDKHGGKKGENLAFDCGQLLGQGQDDRALTMSLVKMGESAVPAIEEALDSYEARGGKSNVPLQAGWVLLAYARIKGPEAFPRLHRLIGNPNLAYHAGSIDFSIALALGLTSYVSSFARLPESDDVHVCTVAGSTAEELKVTPCVPPSREKYPFRFHCDRGDEPRDALDALIQAWETDDRLSLEASLGPSAGSALEQLLRGRTWAAMRSELWAGRSDRNVEVGYRFDAAGRWSEPDETLEERGPRRLERNCDNPGITTLFTNSSGGACGKLLLKFSMSWREGVPQYLADNENLGDVLKLIASCASDTSQKR
jgi:hypothetical protein